MLNELGVWKIFRLFPKGYYQPAEGSVECLACEPGYFSRYTLIVAVSFCLHEMNFQLTSFTVRRKVQFAKLVLPVPMPMYGHRPTAQSVLKVVASFTFAAWWWLSALCHQLLGPEKSVRVKLFTRPIYCKCSQNQFHFLRACSYEPGWPALSG